MKNRRIRFDDNFYMTILSFLFSMGSLTLLILYINDLPIWGYITLSIAFSLFLSGFYIFPKMGIYFNYRLKTIKYLGPHKIKKAVIKMEEIEKIEFEEISAPKKKGITPKGYIAYYDGLNCVYGNGKIFRFFFYLKNGEIIEIPYFNLFKAYSKKRVMKQETIIKEIVQNFNSQTNNK